jgi:hypothetical protein
MTDSEKYSFIQEKIKSGPKFFSFKYKKENGETSFRLVQFGADIPRVFAKRGKPATGKGNWHKGMTGGKGAGTIYVGTAPRYVRGVDMKDNAGKIFTLNGMTELKCSSHK